MEGERLADNKQTSVSSHSIHHQRHHDLSVGLNFCNTTVVAPEFTPGFSGVRVARCLIFYAMFCRSLFVIFQKEKKQYQYWQ
jgi:hypothetical protein